MALGPLVSPKRRSPEPSTTGKTFSRNGLRPDVEVFNGHWDVVDELPHRLERRQPIYLVQPPELIEELAFEHRLVAIANDMCGVIVHELTPAALNIQANHHEAADRCCATTLAARVPARWAAPEKVLVRAAD